MSLAQAWPVKDGSNNFTLIYHLHSRYDLMIGVVRSEAYFALTADDAQYGIEADRRTKILREFVRNTYTYHQAEILATIINEYTDWERPVQHPVNIKWAQRLNYVFSRNQFLGKFKYFCETRLTSFSMHVILADPFEFSFCLFPKLPFMKVSFPFCVPETKPWKL